MSDAEKKGKSKSRTIRVPLDLDEWIENLPPDRIGHQYAQKAITMLYKAKRQMEESDEPERGNDGEGGSQSKRSNAAGAE